MPYWSDQYYTSNILLGLTSAKIYSSRFGVKYFCVQCTIYRSPRYNGNTKVRVLHPPIRGFFPVHIHRFIARSSIALPARRKRFIDVVKPSEISVVFSLKIFYTKN